MKVGINGFGRIGRSVFKIAHDKKVDIAAVNDVHGAESSAYLLKYDSIYGRYKEKVAVIGKDLVVNGKRIKILTERDPNRLPWKEMGVDVVIEATGIFRDKIGAMANMFTRRELIDLLESVGIGKYNLTDGRHLQLNPFPGADDQTPEYAKSVEYVAVIEKVK